MKIKKIITLCLAQYEAEVNDDISVFLTVPHQNNYKFNDDNHRNKVKQLAENPILVGKHRLSIEDATQLKNSLEEILILAKYAPIIQAGDVEPIPHESGKGKKVPQDVKAEFPLNLIEE